MSQRILEKADAYKLSQAIRRPAGTLPESLSTAAGLLKKKYKDLARHYRKLREEWPTYVAK